MSSASPTDLAVAFRSFARRLREAVGDESPQLSGGANDEGAALLGEAGQLLGTTPDPLAIADAIDAVRSDQWDATVLDRLRVIALDLGAWVRRLAARGGQD